MFSELKDLVEHTSGLGLQIIRIDGESDGATVFRSMDTNKSVVLAGSFAKKIVDFEGVAGLSNLDHLKGYLNLYNQKDDNVKVVRKTRTIREDKLDDQGNIVYDTDGKPETVSVETNDINEIVFTRSKPRMKNTYRAAGRNMIPDIPNFQGASWDITIQPTSSAINMLAQQASIGYEKEVGLKTDDGSLFAVFDENDQNMVEIATDVEGSINKSWVWPIDLLLTVLKMSNNADCVMQVSDKGIAQITINTGVAEYNYLLPGRAR